MKYDLKIWSAFARYQIRRFWRRRSCGFWRVELPYCQQIKVPVFKIVDNPIIRISEIKARRFYIVDRAQIRAKNQCFKGESGRPSIFHQLPYERYEIEERNRNDREFFGNINAALA